MGKRVLHCPCCFPWYLFSNSCPAQRTISFLAGAVNFWKWFSVKFSLFVLGVSRRIKLSFDKLILTRFGQSILSFPSAPLPIHPYTLQCSWTCVLGWGEVTGTDCRVAALSSWTLKGVFVPKLRCSLERSVFVFSFQVTEKVPVNILLHEYMFTYKTFLIVFNVCNSNLEKDFLTYSDFSIIHGSGIFGRKVSPRTKS